MATIDTLIRLAKFELDERQRALRELLDQEDRLKDAISALEKSLILEAKAVENLPQLAANFGRYADRARQEREAIEEQIKELAPLIEKARDHLAEAFEEMKRYEITRDNRNERNQKEQDKKDQDILDEQGLIAYRRAHDNEDGS